MQLKLKLTKKEPPLGEQILESFEIYPLCVHQLMTLREYQLEIYQVPFLRVILQRSIDNKPQEKSLFYKVHQ